MLFPSEVQTRCSRPRLPACRPVTQRSRNRQHTRVSVSAVCGKKPARVGFVGFRRNASSILKEYGFAHDGRRGLRLADAHSVGAIPDALPLAGGAVMIDLERPSRRWQVLLNCGGDLSSRRAEFEPKDRSVFSPMVSKEQYDVDRRQNRLSSVIPAAAERSAAPSDRGSEKPMFRSLRLAR